MLLLVVTVLNVWAERKIVADMQSRIGPNRAGPFGILQTVADGLKLFFKESMTPRKAEFVPYILAPVAALLPSLLIFLVVPIGRPFYIGDRLIETGDQLGAPLVHLRLRLLCQVCGERITR